MYLCLELVTELGVMLAFLPLRRRARIGHLNVLVDVRVVSSALLRILVELNLPVSRSLDASPNPMDARDLVRGKPKSTRFFLLLSATQADGSHLPKMCPFTLLKPRLLHRVFCLRMVVPRLWSIIRTSLPQDRLSLICT